MKFSPSSLQQILFNKPKQLAYNWSYYKARKDKGVMAIAEEEMEHYLQDMEASDHQN